MLCCRDCYLRIGYVIFLTIDNAQIYSLAQGRIDGILTMLQGQKYGQERLDFLMKQSALKTDTKLDDCADVYVMLAKNTSMTGQNVQVDAGLNIANM